MGIRPTSSHAAPTGRRSPTSSSASANKPSGPSAGSASRLCPTPTTHYRDRAARSTRDLRASPRSAAGCRDRRWGLRRATGAASILGTALSSISIDFASLLGRVSTSASLRALTSRPRNPLRRELRPGLQGARWITPVASVMPWQLVGTTGLLPERWPESPLRMLRSAFDLLCIGQLSQAVESSVRRAAAGFADGAVAVLVAGSVVGSMPLYVDVPGDHGASSATCSPGGIGCGAVPGVRWPFSERHALRWRQMGR